jgi:hypothetical protein
MARRNPLSRLPGSKAIGRRRQGDLPLSIGFVSTRDKDRRLRDTADSLPFSRSLLAAALSPILMQLYIFSSGQQLDVSVLSSIGQPRRHASILFFTDHDFYSAMNFKSLYHLG